MKTIQLAAAIVLVTLLASSASAQNPVPNNVARPTLSPYLQLLRRQDSVLPNYHLYVRPRIELRNELMQTRSGLQRLDRRITTQGQQFQAANVRATGGGGGYMNYSHFYPNAR